MDIIQAQIHVHQPVPLLSEIQDLKTVYFSVPILPAADVPILDDRKARDFHSPLAAQPAAGPPPGGSAMEPTIGA